LFRLQPAAAITPYIPNWRGESNHKCDQSLFARSSITSVTLFCQVLQVWRIRSYYQRADVRSSEIGSALTSIWVYR
jgi:hypothetical protein